MQFVSLILSLVLLAQFTIFRLPANADTITYNPKGSDSQATVEGKLQVSKVGKLMMQDAYAMMHANQVDIVGRSHGSSKSEGLLSGSIIAPKVHTSGGTTSLTGTVFFTGGAALVGIGSSTVTDLVATVSGGSVVGTIASVDASGVTVTLADGTAKVIAIGDVAGIKSPRSYTFKIEGKSASTTDPLKTLSVDASTIVFTPTRTVVATATTTKSGDHRMSKRTKILLFLSLLAIAIAVPIAVAVPLASGHGGSSANTNILQQLALVNFTKQRQVTQNVQALGGFAHMGGCI